MTPDIMEKAREKFTPQQKILLAMACTIFDEGMVLFQGPQVACTSREASAVLEELIKRVRDKLEDNKDFLSISAALAEARAVPEGLSFQRRVQDWMMQCFSMAICRDSVERNHRFLEEALELVQSNGCTASEAHQLVDYVYGRPVGEIKQECGGVMVTLAALSIAADIDMHDCGAVELSRILQPEIMTKIQVKQAAKPKHSPLPAAPNPPIAGDGE